MQNFCNGPRERGWNQPIILPGWPLSANILTDDYEITLIENGSTRMLPERARTGPALRSR